MREVAKSCLIWGVAAFCVAHTKEARADCFDAYSYWYAQYNADIAMQPRQTHFCWLTQVAGKFDADYDQMKMGSRVYKSNDGYWHLQADISNSSAAQGRCVPYSCFNGDGVNDVKWVSDNGFGAMAWSTGGCVTNNTNAWWGDAATILQSYPGDGKTDGAGEAVNVALSHDAFVSSVFSASDCCNSDLGRPIYGTADSLFIGTQSGGKAAHYAGTFWVQGNYAVNTPFNIYNTMCFFTHIGGKFRGFGESVTLSTYFDTGSSQYRWLVRSTQGSSGSQINAAGACYYYNQWDL